MRPSSMSLANHAPPTVLRTFSSEAMIAGYGRRRRLSAFTPRSRAAGADVASSGASTGDVIRLGLGRAFSACLTCAAVGSGVVPNVWDVGAAPGVIGAFMSVCSSVAVRARL